MNDEFKLAPAEPVEIASDLAERYGYADSVDSAESASALDALVRAHELLLGDDFTAETCGDYLVANGGWVSLAFGEDASSLGFAIDNEYPADREAGYGSPLEGGWGYAGYTVGQAPIGDGSYVAFFYYEDPMYADYLTQFSYGGAKVSAITLDAGREATLALSGFMYLFGSYNEEDRETTGAARDIADAQLVLIDPVTGASMPIEGAVTDEAGRATVSFAEPGTYYLSATCDYEETYVEIVAPWLAVEVVDGGEWPSYRGSDTNNGVTSAATPTTAADAVLVWGAQVGQGWTTAPSAQIVADGALIVMTGETIEKRDLLTGEVLASGEMAAAPSYGYASPTYADGVVYAPLGNGTVQAFDVETLESLWVYTDELGGQALSPIAYADGALYVGFWNGETAEANFVRLSAGDEDPSSPDEAKEADWVYARAGGFYGAGAAVVGGVVIVGCDNGAVESDADAAGAVLSLDAATGALIDEEAVAGDVRASVVVDEGSGSVYASSKGGGLYRFDLDGSGALELAAEADLDGQSTSAPVVYDGRVYVAVSRDAAGVIVVADAVTLEAVLEVAIDEGRPQCSLLLSTGALEETGEIVLYATYNSPPGGLLAVRLASDCASADDVAVEQLYDPTDDGAAQYCVSSVIAAENGIVYYKNDSGRVFAIGSRAAYAAQAVDNRIAALPAADAVTADDADAVYAARAAYRQLDAAGQAAVANLADLEAVEEALGEALAASMSDLVFSDGGLHWVLSEGWIVDAFGRGLVTGYLDPETGEPTGLFDPDGALTRGQAATIIYRYANPGSADTTDPDAYAASDGTFSDLPDVYYYNAAIQWCAEQGIVGGYDDPATGEPTGEFGPDDPVTREQLAKMLAELARWAGLSIEADESALAGFADASEASAFATGYLAWCAENGVLTGDARTGALDPTGEATRAMMAKMAVVTMALVEA